jgi:tetratricopeptide (TPR) repeat protein
MQAAIKVQQDSLVYRAGREAAKQGLRSNAVSLFQRAIEYATAAEKWEEVAKAWTQLGRLYDIGKDDTLAEEAHGRALQVARKYGLKRQEAHALHNLAAFAVDHREGLTAFMYARLAVDAYGQDYGGLSSLANDVAYYWMVSEGAFKTALEVFEACVSYAEKPIDKMDMLANVARAAAGCGLVDRYEDAARQVHELAPEIKHKERVAGAFLELAEGAYALGRHAVALETAEQAKAMAAERGERKYIAHADDVLRKIRNGDAFCATPPSAIDQIRNRDLAERLVRLLKAGRSTKH